MRVTFITVSAQFAAYHKWADAPAEVGFLRHCHRHLFKVKASLKVEHDDRDLEFFIVQRALIGILRVEYEERVLEGMSCEMMAEGIMNAMRVRYPSTFMVEVSEDGENSATVIEEPAQ